MRRASFVALLLVLVASLVLLAPLSHASDNCAAMGAACEGLCGVASCVAVGAPISPRLPLASDLVVQGSEEPPSATPALIELPPRPSLLSA